jgi:hypothetical protein
MIKKSLKFLLIFSFFSVFSSYYLVSCQEKTDVETLDSFFNKLKKHDTIGNTTEDNAVSISINSTEFNNDDELVTENAILKSLEEKIKKIFPDFGDFF